MAVVCAVAACSTTTQVNITPRDGGAGSSSGGSATGGSGGNNGHSGAGGSSTGGSNAGGNGGAGNLRHGTILWARSASSAALYGVAEGSSGVVVTGTLTAPTDLGGGTTLSPKTLSDVVIAQYGIADAKYQSSSQFGADSPAGTGYVYGFLQMLDSGGAPLISGVSYCDTTASVACSKIDVGSGLAAPGGGPGADGFVGRYSVTTGKASWVKRLVGPGEDKLVSVSSGPNDSVYATAWYDANTTLTGGGDSAALINAGYRDIVFFGMNSYTGALGPVKTFATPAFEQPTGLAWTGTNFMMAGFFNGTTQFGTKSLTSVGYDFFFTELQADGTPVWAVQLGSTGDDKYPSMAVDSKGDVYLAGTIAGSATFGTYPVGGAGGNDIVVAKLHNSDGSVAWATSLGSAGDDGVGGITVNSAGEVLVIGNVTGPIEAGGTAFGGQDAVLAAYTSDGVRLWTKVIGSAGTDYGWAVASGVDSFYAIVNPGADIGSTIEGVKLIGAPKPAGVLLKIVP